jgi:hypothetical protein
VEGISQKNFDTIGQEPTPACLAHPKTIAKVAHWPRFNSAVKTEHSEDGGLAPRGTPQPVFIRKAIDGLPSIRVCQKSTILGRKNR